MSSDAFHKILEPYLFAIGLTVLILLGAIFLLYRHGRASRDAASEASAVKRPGEWRCWPRTARQGVKR